MLLLHLIFLGSYLFFNLFVISLFNLNFLFFSIFYEKNPYIMLLLQLLFFMQLFFFINLILFLNCQYFFFIIFLVKSHLHFNFPSCQLICLFPSPTFLHPPVLFFTNFLVPKAFPCDMCTIADLSHL